MFQWVRCLFVLTVTVVVSVSIMRQTLLATQTFGHRALRKSHKQLSANPIDPPWMSRTFNGSNKTVYYIHNTQAEWPPIRLGNQLFFYAALFGICWPDNNTNDNFSSPRHVPLWPDKHPSFLRQTFTGLRLPIDINNTLVQSNMFRPSRLNLPVMNYSASVERLPQANVTINGYVQTAQYFKHVEDQLRIDLTFNDAVMQQARDFINQTTPPDFRNSKLVRVLVHIRRTDYATPLNTSTPHIHGGFPVPTAGYLERSMSYFESLFDDRVQFVVLSDDIPWCRKNVSRRKRRRHKQLSVVFSSNKSPHVDLAIASLCDHAIITAGSFGWWAAWFAGGITIRMKPCSTWKTGLHNGRNESQLIWDLDAFYKPEWVAIEAC